MTPINEFTPMSIYYESFRKEYYLLGTRKRGANDTISIVACRQQESDLYNLETTKDPRKEREKKSFLKIQGGETSIDGQEYIKVSRRGNKYNIIYSNDNFKSEYDNELQLRAPLATPAQILNNCDIQVLINTLVDEKIKDLPSKMISKKIKEAKDDYELRIECMQYEHDQKMKQWIREHEAERLETENMLYKARLQNRRYEKLTTKLKKEVECYQERFNEDMVKKALKGKKQKARRIEGVGLCFKCNSCNQWHHYTEYGGKCEELL
tara:strand:+ start:440 stop:1237 length:798 start_codon:yes stop_codon:yes gene_type:complete